MRKKREKGKDDQSKELVFLIRLKWMIFALITWVVFGMQLYYYHFQQVPFFQNLISRIIGIGIIFAAIQVVFFILVRKEKALIESRQEYQALFEGISDAVAVFGLPRMQLMVYNEHFQRLFGYSDEELEKRTFSHFADPEDLPRMAKKLIREPNKGPNVEFQKEDFPLDGLNKQGQTVYLEARISPYLQKKKLVGFEFLMRDVTEKRKLEMQREKLQEKLIEEKERYATLFEHSGTALILLKNNGMVTKINRKFEQITGYVKKEVEDKIALERLLRPQGWKKQWAQTFKNGKTFLYQVPPRTEFKYIRKDGEVRDAGMTAILIPGTDQILVSFADITEVKRLVWEKEQAQLEALRVHKLASIGELAAGVAHNVNNPLTALLGYLEMLLTTKLDDKQREYTEICLEEVKRIGKTVSSLQSQGKRAVSEQINVVDLGEIIENILQLLKGDKSYSHLQVSTELAQETLVRVNEGSLSEVVMNLIKNARDAVGNRQDGQLRITSFITGKKGYVEFEDNGCGIPESVIGRIFDPFYSTKIKDSVSGIGTGLGLSTSYKIISDLGGTIRVRSKEDMGSTFTLELPLYQLQQNGIPLINLPTPSELSN